MTKDNETTLKSTETTSEINSKPRKKATEKVVTTTNKTKKKTAPKQKNLTITEIRKQAKNVNQMEEYVLYTDEEDNEIKVKFYPVFPATKIQELLIDAQNIVRQAAEKDVEIDDNQFNHHILFLCIKHFTHLKKSLSDDFDEQVVQFQQLVDAGVYEIIINEVFSEKEVTKVFDELAKLRAQHQLLTELGETTQDKLADLRKKQSQLLDQIVKEEASLAERTVKNQK